MSKQRIPTIRRNTCSVHGGAAISPKTPFPSASHRGLLDGIPVPLSTVSARSNTQHFQEDSDNVTADIANKTTPWDAIVIGSGATGGWAALKLAKQGLSVLVLEAGHDGGDLPTAPKGLVPRLKRKYDKITGRRHIQQQCPSYWELDPDLFIVDTQHPYATPSDKPFHWIRTRAVNGRTLTWGGIGVRMSDHELKAAHQDGFDQAWPISYADLAPHYDEVDGFLPVYGERNGLSELPDGQFVGACKLTEGELRFQAALGARMPERKVIPARGVLIRPSARPNGEAGPPSPVRAAVRDFGASLRTNAVVSHLLVGTDGKVNGVAFVDRLSKAKIEVRAKTVALCASTLESTRILLNSRSPQHPDGIGNSSGTLGRYLMDHPALYVSGFLPGKRDEPWSDGGGGPKNIMIPRFHNLQNSAGGDFLRGYGIFGGVGRHTIAENDPNRGGPDEVPFTLVAYGEMLPRPENRVTIRTNEVDAWGIPTLNIECSLAANEHAMRAHMVASITEMVTAAGGRVPGNPHLFAPGAFVHEVGTARMGASAQDSVLNSHAQVWDCPNVFVMDGAAWTTSAWQNPTFTMMAVAGRASEHLATELKAGRI